jgi:hypothetical protein
MDKMSKCLHLDYPVIVLAHPGTVREKTFLIRVADISSSGLWFRSDANLTQGTPTQVVFQLRHGPEKRTLKVKFAGRVVRSDPGGFSIAFEHP